MGRDGASLSEASWRESEWGKMVRVQVGQNDPLLLRRSIGRVDASPSGVIWHKSA